MHSRSSHQLQPLDVTCFGSLKQLYGKRIREAIQNGDKSIYKTEFLYHYQNVHLQAFSKANILIGFKATGLVSLRIQLYTVKTNHKFPLRLLVTTLSYMNLVFLGLPSLCCTLYS